MRSPGPLALAVRVLARRPAFAASVALTLGLARERAREFGVRLALGARPAQVGTLVLAEGIRLTALGAAAGLLGALATGRALQGLLHGVAPGDPITLAAAAVLMVATATAAALPTVLRTARLDPVSVLRDE